MRHGAVCHGRPKVAKRARAVGAGADCIEHGAAEKMVVAADGADHALEVGILPGNGRLVFAVEVLDHGEQVGAADHILGAEKERESKKRTGVGAVPAKRGVEAGAVVRKLGGFLVGFARERVLQTGLEAGNDERDVVERIGVEAPYVDPGGLNAARLEGLQVPVPAERRRARREGADAARADRAEAGLEKDLRLAVEGRAVVAERAAVGAVEPFSRMKPTERPTPRSSEPLRPKRGPA